MSGCVEVGAVRVDLDLACRWVADYTDLSRAGRGLAPFAFPGYDQYDGGTADPSTLTDGDLLAPQLLNVGVSLVSFYGLQRVRSRLEAALEDDALAQDLTELDDQTVKGTVSALYSVLDEPDARPHGVLGTTLSKVLHRKRPSTVVIHDRWVRACYVGGSAPVAVGRRRTWADYMVLLTLAVRDDLRRQQEALDTLSGVSEGAASLSHVRLLDIVAWTSRGRTIQPRAPVGRRHSSARPADAVGGCF